MEGGLSSSQALQRRDSKWGGWAAGLVKATGFDDGSQAARPTPGDATGRGKGMGGVRLFPTASDVS